MKVHVVGGGPAGLYFAILMKKAWPQTAHHGVRAQPAGRHLRLRRGVLRRDARHLRGLRPRKLPRHHRPLRLLGRHRDPFPRHHAPHRRQRLLRLLARDAAEDSGPARALARRRDQVQAEVSPLDPAIRRRRPGGGGRRHQFAHPRDLCRPVQAERRSAAQPLLLDGLDPAVRRLHLLLPRDRARHLHRPLLPVRAARSTWVMETDPADLRAAGPRQARRGGLGAFHGRAVRGGAAGPPPDHQPLDLAQLSRPSAASAGSPTTSC